MKRKCGYKSGPTQWRPAFVVTRRGREGGSSGFKKVPWAMEGTPERQWGSTMRQDEMKAFNGYLRLSSTASENSGSHNHQLDLRLSFPVLLSSFLIFSHNVIFQRITVLQPGLGYVITKVIQRQLSMTNDYVKTRSHHLDYSHIHCQKFITRLNVWYMRLPILYANNSLLGSEFFINLFIGKGQSELHS